MAVDLKSATHLLLQNGDGLLLLIRRFNTGYEDGNFSVVAGHIEPDESAREAMRREAYEEAGIGVALDDLEFVHTMHRRGGDGSTRLDLFFRCTRWSGPIVNAEPHKCDLMSWSDPADLPANTVPYVRAAVTAVADGSMFSEVGWSRP